MSLLRALPEILEESKIEYEQAKSSNFVLKEAFSEKSEDVLNIMAKGDNLSFIKFLMETKRLKEKLNLVYIDPPFFSQSDYGMNIEFPLGEEKTKVKKNAYTCLLYTSDAADEEDSVDLGGRRIIKKKKKK